MKSKFFLIIIYCLSFYQSYSDSTITSKDFKSLIGCWKGPLTYLDYTTNKLFSMPADIIVKDFKKSNIIICSLIYPKEPSANSLDTISISKDGKLLNNEAIKTKRKLNEDSFEIVTEITSIDGNDNRAAIIRHTYVLGKILTQSKKKYNSLGKRNGLLGMNINSSVFNPAAKRVFAKVGRME